MKKPFVLPWLFVLATPLFAQDRFATSVVSYSPGSGSGIYNPANILGGPLGAGWSVGSLHVTTLGTGGNITLGFDVTIMDGPGADFTVFENGFLASPPANIFSEVVFVEVSTNGIDFVRFPNSYKGPTDPPAFGGLPIGTFSGLAGGQPVLCNVITNQIDPFNPVESGGESFDLADLKNAPAVVFGLVDLTAIHFVRLIDVRGGVDTDTTGNLIYDSGGAVGNADIDAVAVINHQDLVQASQPVVDLAFDGQGFLLMTIGDPNGLGDLDLTTLRASIALTEIPFSVLLPYFSIASFDGNIAVLRSVVPFQSAGIKTSLAVSVNDLSGEFAADQLFLQ